MEYTLAEAAAVTGKGKTTLFRAIKSGKLSARRLDDLTFRIDASELARAYPGVPVERLGGTIGNVPEHTERDRNAALEWTPEPPTSKAEVELAVLRVKLEAAEAQLKREHEDRDRERDTLLDTVGDLRKRLDRSEERVLALTAPAAPAAGQSHQEPPSTPLAGVRPPQGLSGLLSRLWGR